MAVANIDDPGAARLPDRLDDAHQDRGQAGAARGVDVEQRLRKLIEILARELEVLELGSKIQSEVRSEIDKAQREYFLRQQMKAIQQELGETDEQQAEVNELREQLDKLEPARGGAQGGRARARPAGEDPAASAEYAVIRTYLDWIVTLPWTRSSEDNLDIAHAREILDRDHYDLEKVKDRILEYLAVRKLKADLHGPILCFVGPPGVGKTSLGRSIAEAIGRKFERISVGGVRDEAEIRGHRRTYIGRDARHHHPRHARRRHQQPAVHDRRDRQDGRGLARRPVERHARGARPRAELHLPRPLPRPAVRPLEGHVHHHGQPARADPAAAARPHGDHQARRLHGRGEAAHRAQVPGAAADRGQRPQAAPRSRFTDEALNAIIAAYTREAGVRNLEREIGTVCRKLAREVAEAKSGARKRFTVNVKRVHELLGRPRIYAEAKRRTSDPGVATGLAWTPVGGDILFIEATAMPGTGHLTVTGQLGDVMKESAQAALSYVRAHARELGVDDDYFPKNDLHIHVPAGAIPKDGPSAGVTMATAICSLVTGTPVIERRGDDRRDHAHRPGAADRRPQGEDARRAARRHPHRDPADAQRGRPRGRAREPARRHDLRAGRPGRAGLGGGHGPHDRRPPRRARDRRGARAARRGAGAARQGAPERSRQRAQPARPKAVAKATAKAPARAAVRPKAAAKPKAAGPAEGRRRSRRRSRRDRRVRRRRRPRPAAAAAARSSATTHAAFRRAGPA